MNQENSNKEVHKQCVSLSIAGLLTQAINGIVAYVAVYFFKPLWDRLVNYWKQPTKKTVKREK